MPKGEKEYLCPNCEKDKSEYREECPECGYADKKIDLSNDK